MGGKSSVERSTRKKIGERAICGWLVELMNSAAKLGEKLFKMEI